MTTTRPTTRPRTGIQLQLPNPKTAETGPSNLKRKARDDDDEERAKRWKNEEEERVFVRKIGPSPGKKEVSSLFSRDDKKEPSPRISSLFGGGDKKEPDMTPVKLKLPDGKK